MASLPVSELIWLALTLVAAGVVMGLFAGLFGVGGGAIVIPVLYEVFRIAGVPDEVRMPLCVGTSLAIIIPTSITSFRSHNARGAADLDVLKRWALPVVAGVVLASAIARHAPEQLFKVVFVVIAGFSALRLLFHPDGWRFADELPGRALMSLYGMIIGSLSALMGIGGGQIANLFMTFHGRSIHQAIATSSGLGALIAVPATLGYIYAGWPRAGGISGRRRAAVSVCARLRLADRHASGGADQHARRPAGRAACASADEAPARDCVRVVFAQRERAVFGEPGGRPVARMERSVIRESIASPRISLRFIRATALIGLFGVIASEAKQSSARRQAR